MYVLIMLADTVLTMNSLFRKEVGYKKHKSVCSIYTILEISRSVFFNVSSHSPIFAVKCDILSESLNKRY